MVYIRSAAALLSGIIFPLYIYPGDGCSAWEPLFTSLSAHPTLPFISIVNPNSGPGSGLPDSNYQACVPSLRPASNPNAKVIGYVPTGFGLRDPAAVRADVDAYAAWGSNYRPGGIFFDEVSTSSDDLALYQSYTTYVRSKTWHESGASFVTFNPGTTPETTDYFNAADLIVTFEDFYDNFSNDDLTINNASPAAKQAVILHTGPSTPPTSVIDELVTQDRLSAVYITDIPDDASTGNNPYGQFPTDWDAFVQAVEDAASA